MSSDGHSTLFRVVFGIVETLAIVVGLPLTIFSLMAVVGEFTANFWIQLGIAAVAALFVPFLVADRLLPKGDRAAQVRGLVSDVLAVSWLGFGFLFTTVAAPATGSALHRQADLLSERGVPASQTIVSLLAGPPAGEADSSGAVRTAESSPSPQPPTKADASSDAAAPSPDAGTDAASTEPDDDQEEGDDEELTPAEVFEQNAPAVVSIRTKIRHPLRPDKTVKSGGTGFFVDEGGIIGTNYHVIKRAESAEVKLWDGRKTEKVWVLETDEDLDLALLEIDFDDMEGEMDREPPGGDDEIDPIEFGDSDDVEVGQRVVAIGNPLGLDHTLTDGLVSQRRIWKGKKMIQVSVPLSPGNSGGPLMNLHGEVVGVSTAKLGNAWNRGDGLNLAVPINKLEEMLGGDYPDKREIGTKDKSDSGTW